MTTLTLRLCAVKDIFGAELASEIERVSLELYSGPLLAERSQVPDIIMQPKLRSTP